MTSSPRFRRPVVSALVAGVAAALALPLVAVSPAAAATPDTYLSRRVADGTFHEPTAAAASPTGAGNNRIYVVERRGTVARYDVDLARPLAGYYLDLRSVVNDSGGEQGLLGLAFDPKFASGRPYVFASYTRSDGALVVVRLKASRPSAYTISASTRRTVLVVPHPGQSNHNGGNLMFGKDGFLYIGTGDGGGAGDPGDNARDRTVLNGKVLRLDTAHSCGGKLYCSARGNPFASSSTYRHEIYLYGVRNPWKFSQDPVTGTLWIGDVGQDAYEEVDRVATPATVFDLGWPCREGFASYSSGRCGSAARQDPLLAYSHSVGESITGGYVYRGKAFPQIVGRYLFADFISGTLFSTGSSGVYRTEASLGGITTFAQSASRELFVLTYGGGMHRVMAR
ncbi:PQQ-dependent sugar dehydrogenase [Angustibacter peucedani]